ncbi:MAG: hypothetical protein FWD71_23435 [Oscillospiraceae bacterium]|nr:hypothetical protein [Oscillospiraceae bacterium]
MRFNNGFKNFRQEKNEKQAKPKAKRFSPTVSFLIVGTLVIIAFFRGIVSDILLIILFAGFGLYKLIPYIKMKMTRSKQRADLHGGDENGKNDAV